jgi:hypothetical protein
MPLWGNKNLANNAPKENNVLAGVDATGSDLFGNTTPNAFVPNMSVGVFAANTADAKSKKHVKTPGWYTVKYHTGPIVGLGVANGGAGFSNTDTVRFSGGSANGAATITTDANGAITSFHLTNGGLGFANAASVTSTFLAANGSPSAGNTAAVGVSYTFGGRAGRVQTECLAVVKITSNTSIPVT